MTLYFHPVSTASRIVRLALADSAVAVEVREIDLIAGEQNTEAYRALNPSGLLPLLRDGDFALTESSAINRYVAERNALPTYPSELRARARVNEAMAWFETQVFRDFNRGYVFPQVMKKLPAVMRAPDVLAASLRMAQRWLDILERERFADGRAFLCGEQVTLADYTGATLLGTGRMIDFDLSPWGRVAEWMRRMMARPAWCAVDVHPAVLIAAYNPAI